MAVGLDLDQYHFVKRPLLVFAPTPRDVRYEEQRGYLEDDEEGREASKIELFAIFEEGPSFAGGRPVAHEEARGARERFGVGEGGFGLYLIDLDGTVIVRSDEPVPLDQIIEGIPEEIGEET